MPDTILKRWNGSSFEELYPKTTVGQISASGTASSSTFLRGDGQWIAPAGGGDVVGPASATTGRVATFNGTTGKLIQDGGVLLSNLVSGPASAVTARFASFNGTTGKIIQDSGFTSSSFAAASHTHTKSQITDFAHTHAVSDITSGVFLTSVFNTTLASNTTSGTITVDTNTQRLWFFASMSGFTTIRIMFPVDWVNIPTSTTLIYRIVWNNGTGTFADNLTINRGASNTFTFANSAGNGPWTYRIYRSERL